MKRAGMLVAAAWLLFMLAALAVAGAAYLGGQAELARRMAWRMRLYYAVRAGVEDAVTVAQADSNGWDALNEPWGADAERFQNVPCGVCVYSVTRGAEGFGSPFGLWDEGGRVDLNQADGRMLRAVFEGVGGTDSNRATALASAVIRQRTVPAEGETAAASGLLPRGPFVSVEELRWLEGMDDELMARLRGSVTVHGRARVNVNTADETVLAALAAAARPGVSGDLAAGLAGKLAAFRAAGGALTNDQRGAWAGIVAERIELTADEAQLFRDAALMLTVRGGCLGGRVTARPADGGNESRSAVFVWDRDERRMRFWHED